MLKICILQPANFLGRLSSGPDESGKHLKIEFDHGTTTLGFMYQGGIVLSVDSRATGGQFIGTLGYTKYINLDCKS